MLAHLCMNRSLKLATAATVAPVQYTLLLWSVILGYLVFGDVPTSRMLLGAAIIVAAGLVILWRERAAGPRTARSSSAAVPEL
jgi:drug/metabolite transporter (DMT)-like permease